MKELQINEIQNINNGIDCIGVGETVSEVSRGVMGSAIGIIGSVDNSSQMWKAYSVEVLSGAAIRLGCY